MADSSISFYPASSLCSSVHSKELAKLHLHRSYLAPVIIVSKPSQLPAEFLETSPLRKLVIGFDNEGVRLSRHGALCVMQLAFNHSIYLVDAIEGGEVLIKACKAALESEHVTKVIHDCKGDGEALFFQLGIKLNNVVDTQIAYSLLEAQEGRKTTEHVSFVELLANARYCGAPYPEKEEVRQMLKSNPQFWRHRPITQFMASTAAYDVLF